MVESRTLPANANKSANSASDLFLPQDHVRPVGGASSFGEFFDHISDWMGAKLFPLSCIQFIAENPEKPQGGCWQCNLRFACISHVDRRRTKLV